MTAPHILIVERETDDDDWTASVECPGVTDSCRCWWECPKCVNLPFDEDEALWETEQAHGVEHQRIDGSWMVPGNGCISHHIENDASEAAADLPTGRYPVEVEFDDGFVYVRLIPGGAA